MIIKYFIDKEQIYNFHMSYIEGTDYYIKKLQSTGRAFLIRMPIYFLIFFSFFGIGPALFFLTILIILYFRKHISCRNIVSHNLKRLISNNYLKYLTEDTTVEVETAGIHVTTALTDKTYKWNSIKSINIIDNYILIETHSFNEKLLIPSIAFASEKYKMDFVNIISQNSNIKIKSSYPKEILFKSYI